MAENKRLQQIYDALKSDGQFSQTKDYNTFAKRMNERGYSSQIWKNLKQAGADVGKNPWEMRRWLGIQEFAPKPQQAKAQTTAQQSSKPMTTSQRAMQVNQEFMQSGGQKQQARQGTSYIQKPQQQPRQQQPRSAFVQGLYDQNDLQKQANGYIDYASPKATQQMLNVKQSAQNTATRRAVDAMTHNEERRRNQPIVKTGTPADQSIVMTQGQVEDQENAEIGAYLDKVIGDEFKNAHARGLAALSAAGGPYTHGTGGADWYVGERAYQQQVDAQKQLENVTANVSKQIENVFSDPKVRDKVMSAAARLNLSPEEYINQHLAPALLSKTNEQFNKTQLNRMMAQGASDYIAGGILNSLTGTLLTGLTTSKNQRQMQQEADAMTEQGMNPNYQPGIVGKATRGAVGFMADAPAFNIAGKAGTVVAGRLFGSGVSQVARLANMSKLQRTVYMAKNGVVSQGVTGFLYGSTNAVAQNMSTGEDNSIGTNLKLALKGGISEGSSFATMGGIGGAVGGFGYGIGVNGAERSVGQTIRHMGQKVGYEGFKVVSEGIGMHVGGQVANLIENGEFDLSVSGTLEDVANVVALKLTHAPKLNRMRGENGKKESFGSAIARNFANFVSSDAAKNKMWELSNDDKDMLMASGGLKDVKDLKGISDSYQKIMADPNVSWDAKAKYSAMVMGTMPSSRPMGDYHTFSFEKVGGDNAGYKKYISEYAADGTLLSKRSYDTADERARMMYNDEVLRENNRLSNGFALSVNADTSSRDMQAEFLRSKGFDESKPLDYHVNATLAAGMQDHESSIYKEFVNYAANHGETSRIVEAVAEQNGMTKEQLIDAFQNKEPLKRTDAEQNACVQLRRAFENSVFKEGEVHPEQSQMEGKDVAEDRGLGTEQPDGEIVKAELGNLKQAETGVEELIRDNDVFGQNFEALQKQGLTNPQIYGWMVQQGGLTVEQLEPFARYINANARVQGMQDATAKKIEEVVQQRVSDWSYHGTLNGEKNEGGNTMLYVEKDGITYLVGSGDVAFDSTTGRAKEDVGDMLVGMNPVDGSITYISVKDVKFVNTEAAEEYSDIFRQALQNINSVPYNEAAQQQAMVDAAKPQNAEESIENKNENTNDKQETVTKPQQGTNGTVEGNGETRGNATEGVSVAQQVEQPQPTRKFVDGTEVPMTKDSKGRHTPDYANMKPEQAAEILTQDFGESAEKVADGQIKKAEKALKDAEKMKVDYTAELNDIMEQEQVKAKTVEAAKKQLEQAQNIKKAMTAKKVAETVAKTAETGKVEGAHEAGSAPAQKFQSATRLVGNKRTRMLADGETKIRGHYEIVPAESLTPSHDVNNGYKMSEGFPVDENGHTINDRDYEHDKAAQVNTDYIASKYNGQAIEQVPVVSDEGIVYDGNGRTMAGQKAAKDGTDGEYINDLLENAENFGFTREQIEQSGIEHPRVVLVTDERLPYDTATFAKFNRNEKKAQSNTEQAVAKAKTLTSDEVGAIVADIEGNGSLDAFFNNPNAINDLIKTLQTKGVLGQNEVSGLLEDNGRLNAQGREYVKNLLLGSIFKPDTIRMLGIDGAVKNKAIAGIRAIMDNMKLGDYSLRDEIDQAIQLLYEARQGGNKVDTLLRTEDLFNGNAADRYPSISQMMALALEGKPSDFRDLLNEYNQIAAQRNTGEGGLFGEAPTKEKLVNEYLKFKEWQDYGTRNQEGERSNDVSGVEESQPETSGGNEPEQSETQQQVDEAIKYIATEITKQAGIKVTTDDKVGQSALEDAEATDSNVKFHKETDEEVLNALNNGETIKVYRAMQVINGKLYPPMAASVGGKLVEANELGVWIRADENPDLAIPDIDPKTGKQKVDKKTGELKWKFKLDKGGKDATGKKATDIPAAYNPYWHMSRSPLNDQFKSAWIRPNIVVVECETPVSELTSGYKAERAKDAVGEVDWKSGSVSGEVFKQTGRARKVILSRWCKPVRVLDDAEVAQRAKEFVGEAKVVIPENVLTPKQRIAFEEAGFKIGAPEKGVKKSEQILEALEKGLQIDNTVREQREAGGAVLDWGNVPSKARLNNDELTTIIMQNNRAYIDELNNLAEGETIEHYVDANGYFYTFRVDKNHHIYMDEAIPKTSSANKERINELKNYYNEERARHLETVRSDRGESQSELGRSTDSDGSTIGGRDSQDSAVGGGSERTDTKGNVERDSSRSEQSGSKIKEFRSKNGEVYGFVLDGEIYLDTKKMKKDTALHEYTHLWTEALRNANPTEWENVKGLFDEVEGLKEEVQKLYPELKGDDLYEEMITTFSGREGAKKLEEVVRGLASEEGKTVSESAKAVGFIGKVKQALQKYWKGVADMLHIHFTSAEDVADKVLADWASGFNPNEVEEKQEPITIMPKPVEPSNPIEKAAEDYKKEHPLTEQEILNTTAFDDLPEEMKQYCIEAALDYLNGEDKSATSEAYYRNIFAKRSVPSDTKTEQKNAQGGQSANGLDEAKSAIDNLIGDSNTTKPQLSADPMEAIRDAAGKYHENKDLIKEKEDALSKVEYEVTTAVENGNITDELRSKFIKAATEFYLSKGFLQDSAEGRAKSFLEAVERQAYLANKIDKNMDYTLEEELELEKLDKKSFNWYDARPSSRALEGKPPRSMAEIKAELAKLKDQFSPAFDTKKPKKRTRKQLEAEKNAADNEFEAFMKDLKKKRRSQLNSGFIDQNLIEAAPKMFSLAAKCAYTRIKLGIYDAKEVVKDLRERFKEAFEGFDKKDIETFYSEIMNQKWRDGDKRMSLNDWAEHYRKLSPEYKEKLEGSSKDAEERKQNEANFIGKVRTRIIFSKPIKSITELRKLAEDCGLKGVKDTDLQELAESAVVSLSREVCESKAMSDEVKFKKVLNIYNNQPSLNQRDSERVMKQQYSTPAPYAFLADMYVKGNGKEVKSALEPSAGNGMLTIGLPMDVVHVNDIDAQRLANLRRQGFKNVTSQDGTQPFADKDVDVVVTNPPFGSATPKEYDGYKISSLEGQMAINALESMKDDGRAAIIIGGKTEYAKNGSLNPKDKAFLGYLYSHYNVEDVINVDGSLYAKQGTTYPTRIILINGRRKFDPENKVYPPVEKNARAEAVKDYDELYKRISDDILRNKQQSDGILDKQAEESGRVHTDMDVHRPSKEGVRESGRDGRGNNGIGLEGHQFDNERPSETSVPELGGNENANGETAMGLRSGDSERDGGRDLSTEQNPEPANDANRRERLGEGNNGGRHVSNGVYGRGNEPSGVSEQSPTRGVGQQRLVKETPKRELSTEKVKYVPQSNNPFSLNSVIPADQAKATKKALEKIGDVDGFLVDELGYNDADDMHHALASEQADSVALAIHQAKQGNAFIIGDMTGIGKGRQAAAMIRFAHKQGKIPVFITAKKDLFSDMYRDLKSIGNSDLRPFIWAADDKEHSADMTDSEGKLVYKRTSDKEQERVMVYLEKNGKLPEEYDYIVTTYDSFSGGTMDYENGKKTARKDGKGSKKGQRKRDVLETIAKNANIIMDESHRAGGQGQGSAYLQYVVPKLNAITFLSATYAKRPDNMPIYALRTSMNQAGMKPSELIDAIKRGGATLQEIMSQSLTASGQFIRRERDMAGVSIDWKTIDDPAVVAEQREQYDSIISLFNDIINFQRTYVDAYLDKRNDELAAFQATIKNRQGTKDLGIHNQPFASRTYNMVQQVLLSLKAKEAAKSAIEHLKNGEKVVIALNNTNESQTDQYEANTEIDAPDLGVVLQKGLQGVLRYDQSDDMGNKTYGTFNLEELGPDAVARYHEIENNIKNASTGLSLSPIDVIRDELEGAGYKVGELTGRQFQFVKNPNGSVSKVKRTDTDKKKLALEFNTNQLDALILNRSASTGISLHDSVEYDVEHKPRTMIVVQQQADVNEEVQMRGRIDRTGQVNRGKYEYIVSQIPSEQRLLMMFKAKLKSLDANTTSSQKSKFNEMEVQDITNKYGDRVVREYMAEHLDLYSRMADPFGWEKLGEDLTSVNPQVLIASKSGVGDSEAGADASKLLGRMALLKVSEQEQMLQEIGERYANEINRLNEMGENDLEITELPLKAKTISKEVWKEGSEPNGDNAFADNTYIEKVNMAILKKPMKAEEVQKAQEGLTGGRSWDEYKAEKQAEIKAYFDEKIASEKERLEARATKLAQKAAERYNKEAKKNQDKNQLSDEQIEKNTQYQYNNVFNEEKKKAETAIKNIETRREAFERVLETFNTEDAYVLPTDMNKPDELSAFGNSYGRLIDIKITNNFSPSGSTVSFATLDGRRKITFPVSGTVGIGDGKRDIIAAIDRMTKQAPALGDKQLRVLTMDVKNWDKLVSNESRKDGYIITGNLMQALIDTKAQGVGGQLVKYTTEDGEVKTGILMPDRFKATDVANEYPISTKGDALLKPSFNGGVEEVVSSDESVKITYKSELYTGRSYYDLRVPKSKAKGGKYFLDEELLHMVNGHNFESRGNTMMAEVSRENLKPVLARLSNLGVKVREERKSSEDGTHFREDRSVQYSKTDSKDVKNSRIIPEDVDKSVSSQIEKKFDDAVKETSDTLSGKDKEYFDKEVEANVSMFSKARTSVIKNALNGYEHDFRRWGNTGTVGESGSSYLANRSRITYLAAKVAAERELDYREARKSTLRDNYNLQSGGRISLDTLERIFKDANRGKESEALFGRCIDIAKKLGVEFNAFDEPSRGGVNGESGIDRTIGLYLDSLVRTYTSKEELPTTILHEMLHQATVGSINLVKKGKADGVLTPKQIEGVNTILDIYNKVKDDKERFKEQPYGLSNEYELTAQMADPRQRKAMDLSIWDRVVNAAHEFARKGDRSILERLKDAVKKLFEVSDKDKMDKAINDIMDDFNETIDDISMNEVRQDGFANVAVSKDAPVVVKHVAEVAKKVGGKVNMVSSVDEITNPQAKKAIEEGKNVTGWYDEKTGEVHLYMPNIHDRYTAEKTIWHEVVGHKGMRELMGEDYEKFLRDVWYNLDKPEYASLKKLVDEERRYNPLNIYDAIEEGIARLAEEGRGEAGLWNSIKNKVSDLFHEIGYRIAPNTKDVKYLLWLSKNLQKNPNDPYWKIRAEAVKYRLDHEDVPSVIERNGMFFDNDGKSHDYLLDLNRKDFEEATDGKVHFRTSPMTASKIDEYNRKLGTKTYAFKESTVNHLQALEEAMKLITGEKDVWKDIPSAFNPLQAANRIESIEEQICWKYDEFIAKPLDAAFNKIVSAMDGKDASHQKQNAELYMIAKHGLERNRVFFVRDALNDMSKDESKKADAETLRKDFFKKQDDLYAELENGKIRLDQYFDQMDEWIRNNVDSEYDASEHDYSGLTEIEKMGKVSDPNYSIMDAVMSVESKIDKSGKDFWNKKKLATDFVIEQEYANGFIDRERRDYLKNMFKWYVPLRNFNEATAEDIYGYITEKGDPDSYIGPTIARAKGRNSLSDTNVMAQIAMLAKSSVMNGGKNIVKQHFARFVQAYENGGGKDKIFVEVNPWMEKHIIDGKEVWEEVTPQIPDNATQGEISDILQDFENKMQSKKATGDAKLITRKASTGYKFMRAQNKSQHLVEVYIAGKKRTFFCQGNPRAAQAINGLLRDSGARNEFTKWSAKINRRCAQLNTSYNPDFFSSNLMRDLTFASANITKEGVKYTTQFCKEYYNNLKFMNGENNYWKMFSKYRNGKLDTNNERQRMFKEFMENGGQTGFVQFEKLDTLIKEYDNLVKNGVKDADGLLWRQLKSKGGFIESANEMFENIARFSCYVTSRKAGRSVGRSIYDAKEVSTNFNKHGSGDAIKSLKTETDSKSDVKFRKRLGWFNSYMKNQTMFYNAGVQGASLLFRNSKQYAKVAGTSFGALPFALSFAVAAINNYLINNEDKKERGGVIDPYAELPDYKRRGSICLYVGKGHFATIPMGIELRAAYGIGDIAAGHSLFPSLKSDTPVGYDILGQVAQLVPASDFFGHRSPGDSAKDVLKDAALTVTPTYLKPEAELLANRDWTGRPIYRDRDYLDKAPQWKSAYDNTSGMYMTLNKWANQATNGIDSSNPDMKGSDVLDYATAPYTWQHIVSGYLGGVGATVGRIANTGMDVGEAIAGKKKWEEIDPNQIPIWRNFIYTSTEGHDMQRTKSKWFNYAAELEQLDYNIKQLKTNTSDPVQNIKNAARQYNFGSTQEGKQLQIYDAANKYIRKKRTLLNKASDPEARKSIEEDINRKMQEAVNDLDKLQ